MTRITYDELERMLRDPSIPDAQIAPYLMADPEAGGPFDPRVVPDPSRVAMDEAAEFRVESAMRWANAICRWRRQQRFRQRRAAGERLPVLVSEGDSWFQFPFLIEDVIDCLGPDHLIWSLDAAGDTAENMVRRNPEYLAGLRAHQDEVAAFLFSAAGNDVIGEDEFGEPVLKSLVKSFTAGKDAAWHVNQAHLAEVLLFLEGAYNEVTATIRAEFPTLPILIHGYDYAIPGGHPGEWRSPGWAEVDQWLGKPFAERGIRDLALQQDIIRILIDALYDMLHRVAGDSSESNIHVVDVRGTLRREEWADEIHGTSRGFTRVAELFRTKLRDAGVPAPAV